MRSSSSYKLNKIYKVILILKINKKSNDKIIKLRQYKMSRIKNKNIQKKLNNNFNKIQITNNNKILMNKIKCNFKKNQMMKINNIKK